MGHPDQAFLFTSFWLIGDRSFIVDCTPLHDPDGTAWHLGTHPEIMALFLTAKFRTWRADLFTGLREVLGSGPGDVHVFFLLLSFGEAQVVWYGAIDKGGASAHGMGCTDRRRYVPR